MEFIETPHFTRQITALAPDESYRLVQNTQTAAFKLLVKEIERHG